MLEGRYFHGSVSIKNKLYMIVGADSQQALRCEVYDRFSDLFVHILPRMPDFGIQYSRLKCVTVGSEIIVFKNCGLKENVVYDVVNGEWSEVFKNKSRKKQFSCDLVKSPKF